MASTNDQLLTLQSSAPFRRRCEGFAAEWAHSVLAGGTANQKTLALQILQNSSAFINQYIGRVVFSDNVVSPNETVTYDFAAGAAVSSISDADLQSQIAALCIEVAG